MDESYSLRLHHFSDVGCFLSTTLTNFQSRPQHSKASAIFKLAKCKHTPTQPTLVFPITSSFQLTTEPIWRTRPNQKNRWAKWVESTSPDCSRRYIAVIVWKRVFQKTVQIRLFPVLFEQTEQYCRIRKSFGSLRYEMNIFSSLNISKIDFKTTQDTYLACSENSWYLMKSYEISGPGA